MNAHLVRVTGEYPSRVLSCTGVRYSATGMDGAKKAERYA
jgi:hypothetical protein